MKLQLQCLPIPPSQLAAILSFQLQDKINEVICNSLLTCTCSNPSPLILPSRISIVCHTHLYHYHLHKLKLCLNWLFFHPCTHKLFIHIAKPKYECSYRCPQGLHYLLLQIPTSTFISNIIY